MVIAKLEDQKQIKMAIPRILTLAVILTLIAVSTFAQNTITGIVIDAQTQKPIVHAEVFISGTTTGCITNKDGSFSLESPFFPCVVVVDHVSYDSYIKTLKFQENLRVLIYES